MNAHKHNTALAGFPAVARIDRDIMVARQARLYTFIDKVMEPQPLLSPDERIDAAIEEIKLAYREKWPDEPIYIRDLDNIDNGMVLIMTSDGIQAPRTIKHERVGAGWRKKGREQRPEGGAA